MKKSKSNAKTILNRLGKLSGFLTDLDADAGKDDCFDVPLQIVRKAMMFDVSVLYKVTNVIENRLILEVVKTHDPKGLRPDLTEGHKIRVYMDHPEKKYQNEACAFLNRRTSAINVPGTGCDIMGYVYLPENFGGVYLFGGDFHGNESSIEDHEVACVDIMCNFLSTILLKTRFEHQAEYDDLTGVYNSGKIKEEVETILKRFERKPSSSACIAMADIDFFKKINDTHGHIQGDLVLKKIGDILSNSMRGVFDVAGRYGGEEFLLIFDETAEAKAIQIVERLREKIEDTQFELTDTSGKIINNKFIHLTMSFGIAGLNKDSEVENAMDWINRADKALYVSKQKGRNRTTFYNGK